MTDPRNFSPIGLTVTDLDAAVKFYAEVLDWYRIMPPTTRQEDASPIGLMCTDVFGRDWGSLRIAHWTSALSLTTRHRACGQSPDWLVCH